MQLAFILAVVLSFSALLNVDAREVDCVPEKLTALGMLATILAAHAWWIGQLRIHGTVRLRSYWFYRQAERHFAALYLGYVFALVVICDFPAIAHTAWGLSSVLWGDDLILIAALTAPIIASWYLDPGELATGRVGTVGRSDPASRIGYSVAIRTRHLLLLPLIPVLLATGLSDLMRLLGGPGLDAWQGAVNGVAMLGFVLVSPKIVRLCWPTQSLPSGFLRDEIERLVRRSGVKMAELLRWDTGNIMSNAAVAGLLPRVRYLFLTDRLVRDLEVQDVLAITAHELGHCRRRHLERLLLSVFLLASGLLVLARLAEAVPVPQLSLLCVVWTLVWLTIHMRFAKCLELEADWLGCELMGEGRVTAVQVDRFMSALWCLEPNPNGDWLHPSPGQREQHLTQMLLDPSRVERFQAKISCWTWCLGAAILGLISTAALL